MIALKIRTLSGTITDLRCEEILSINGEPFQLGTPLAERVTQLETTMAEIVAFLQTNSEETS